MWVDFSVRQPVRLGLAALRPHPCSDLAARRNRFNQCGGTYRRFPMRLNDAKRVGNDAVSAGAGDGDFSSSLLGDGDAVFFFTLTGEAEGDRFFLDFFFR